MAKHTKKALMEDIEALRQAAITKGYGLGFGDIFALGYMCGKQKVSRLAGNQEEVIAACRKYDDTDDLMLCDTIGETLIDLGFITNEKGIL